MVAPVGLVPLLVMAGAGAVQDPPPPAVPNLIPNAAFEDVQGEAPRAWRRSRWNGRGSLSVGEGRSGRGVRIESAEGADVGWSCTVPVEIGARYRLSGYIRTRDVVARSGAKGALFNVHNVQPVQTPAVVGSRDWTRVEVEFDVGFEDSVTINCLFGGWGLATGSADYDDLELVLVKKGEMPAPRIEVDASDVRAPLSKYVYGQFIEHLGRCIYGGIWAEVVEDRKFFAPVGSEESPWQVVGTATTVTMSTDEALAGAHAVQVALGEGAGRAGIRQTLPLRADVAYVGHVWLRGDASAAPIAVGIAGDGKPVGHTTVVTDVRPTWTRVPISLDPAPRAGDGAFEIVGSGRGTFCIGAVSLMPADHVQGFRTDTLALLRELDAPVYRWPGGNFVSGYDWRDGIGERDRRPPRKNPAWQGIESNDVGVDEFMSLCSLLGTDPYIAVNTGLGGVDNAIAELQYVNGKADSAWGSRRARNGHAEPYGVKFWGIGNEMYGDWQLGHVPLADYVQRHKAFVEAMRHEDPSIQVIGVGAVGTWSETMLRECADHLDFLSEHVYWQERPGLVAHVKQAPDSLRRIAEAHARYRKALPSLAGKDIRIVQDEWNYWYGPHVFGELGTRYFVKDALGVAAALHEFARHSALFFMANYAQTVNVIGAIKTTPQSAWLETTGLVLKLYRKEFGTLPVATTCSPSLDAMAALSADRRSLTLGVVNPTAQELDVPLTVRGARLRLDYESWRIAGDPAAYNDAGAERVKIENRGVLTADLPADTTPGRVRLAPTSVTLFRFTVVK
ncbi:MAG: alpha-L-arabinofuranosidase C-terminal domain-containing protein [Planctomycetota bacterium]